MSLSPSPYSGMTSGALARASDPATLSQQELQLVASGDKVTGGRKRRRSGRKSSRKSARKSSRRSRRRRSVRSLFMM